MPRGMAATLVADETLFVLNVLSLLSRLKAYLVNIHGIWIPSRACSLASLLASGDEAVSSFSESFETDHVPVELSSLTKPLFSLLSSFLQIHRNGHSSHHGHQLLCDSSLKGINEDRVGGDSTAGLGKSKHGSIPIKVSLEVLSHGEGIDGLASSVLEVLQDEGLGKDVYQFLECLICCRNLGVPDLNIPAFHEGSSSSIAHLVECYKYLVLVAVLGLIHCEVCPHGKDPSSASSFPPKKSSGKPAFNSPLSSISCSSSGGDGLLGSGLYVKQGLWSSGTGGKRGSSSKYSEDISMSWSGIRAVGVS